MLNQEDRTIAAEVLGELLFASDPQATRKLALRVSERLGVHRLKVWNVLTELEKQGMIVTDEYHGHEPTFRLYWAQDESEIYLARSLDETREHVRELTGEEDEDFRAGPVTRDLGASNGEGGIISYAEVALDALLSQGTAGLPMQVMTAYA